jgi:hypothetical protein
MLAYRDRKKLLKARDKIEGASCEIRAKHGGFGVVDITLEET